MRDVLKLGFVPLTDAAPLIVAEQLGFFRQEGLAVELSREVSWATVRDKVAVGALDGAHMLAPMALASSLEMGRQGGGLIAPFVLNRGGAALTLAAGLVRQEDPAGGLRRLVAQRRAHGSGPLTLAVVFPHSVHTYLLRRWLADAGLDPDRDAQIIVAAPSRMAELLFEGAIEGFCAGQPWSVVAVSAGAGQVVARASHLWPDAPDKVLAMNAAALGRRPDCAAALVRALRRAAHWIISPAHRTELGELLARPEHVGVAQGLLLAGLDDIQFAGDDVTSPRDSDGAWLVDQMSRAGQLGSASTAAAAAAARGTFRPDLYRAALIQDA